MSLPLFDLLSAVNELTISGELIGEAEHEKVQGAYEQQFEIVEGQIILTLWQHKLHCVVYQTPFEGEEKSFARNEMLFRHYGDGQPFHEILDNGFGKTFQRADMERFALWSYVMDFTTIGTMEFHAALYAK